MQHYSLFNLGPLPSFSAAQRHRAKRGLDRHFRPSSAVQYRWDAEKVFTKPAVYADLAGRVLRCHSRVDERTARLIATKNEEKGCQSGAPFRDLAHRICRPRDPLQDLSQ